MRRGPVRSLPLGVRKFKLRVAGLAEVARLRRLVRWETEAA